MKAKVDANIFGIDWQMTQSMEYFSTAPQAVKVGVLIGHFVGRLITDRQLDPDRVLVIGYSLGAQAAGHLGRTVANVTESKVAKITGLEPAKPWFDQQDPSVRIGKDDAKFVEIVHTNSGNLIDVSFNAPNLFD